MKLAVVVPPGAQDALPPCEAHFAFAPSLFSDQAYSDWAAGKPNLIIDCPIYEGGEAISAAQFVMLSVYKPTFLIIPDVRGSARETLIKMQPYLARTAEAAATGVIQGRSLKDCLMCAMEMVSNGIARFAVPKDLTWRTGQTRLEIMHRLVEIIGAAPVHLLGADWPYQDEKACGAAFSQIYSVDTAEPTNAAINKNEVRATTVGRPLDFMQCAQVLVSHQEILHGNIRHVNALLH